MFKNKKTTKKEIPSRIKYLSDSELTSWIDTTIMWTGKSFDQWRYHNGPDKEVSLYIDSLNNLWEELCRRNNV